MARNRIRNHILLEHQVTWKAIIIEWITIQQSTIYTRNRVSYHINRIHSWNMCIVLCICVTGDDRAVCSLERRHRRVAVEMCGLHRQQHAQTVSTSWQVKGLFAPHRFPDFCCTETYIVSKQRILHYCWWRCEWRKLSYQYSTYWFCCNNNIWTSRNKLTWHRLISSSRTKG